MFLLEYIHSFCKCVLYTYRAKCHIVDRYVGHIKCALTNTEKKLNVNNVQWIQNTKHIGIHKFLWVNYFVVIVISMNTKDEWKKCSK